MEQTPAASKTAGPRSRRPFARLTSRRPATSRRTDRPASIALRLGAAAPGSRSESAAVGNCALTHLISRNCHNGSANASPLSVPAIPNPLGEIQVYSRFLPGIADSYSYILRRMPSTMAHLRFQAALAGSRRDRRWPGTNRRN